MHFETALKLTCRKDFNCTPWCSPWSRDHVHCCCCCRLVMRARTHAARVAWDGTTMLPMERKRCWSSSDALSDSHSSMGMLEASFQGFCQESKGISYAKTMNTFSNTVAKWRLHHHKCIDAESESIVEKCSPWKIQEKSRQFQLHAQSGKPVCGLPAKQQTETSPKLRWNVYTLRNNYSASSDLHRGIFCNIKKSGLKSNFLQKQGEDTEGNQGRTLRLVLSLSSTKGLCI